MWAQIGEHKLWEIRTVKLLGITIDNNLKFPEYLNNICMKANSRLTTLTRVRKYLDNDKMRILFKPFLDSQFKYRPFT